MASTSNRAPSAQSQEKHRGQLLAFVTRLQSDARSLDDQARAASGGRSGGNLSNAPMHLADSASDQFAQELDATLLENAEFIVGECRAALDRIDLGTYGHCEECGNLISQERLDVMPYVRLCMPCAERFGSGLDVNLNRGRPERAESLAPERMESSGDRLARADDDAVRPRRTEAAESAAETPGGGSAAGGLAGSNSGRGEPNLLELQQAGESGSADQRDAVEDRDDRTPRSGRAGGAVQDR